MTVWRPCTSFIQHCSSMVSPRFISTSQERNIVILPLIYVDWIQCKGFKTKRSSDLKGQCSISNHLYKRKCNVLMPNCCPVSPPFRMTWPPRRTAKAFGDLQNRNCMVHITRTHMFVSLICYAYPLRFTSPELSIILKVWQRTKKRTALEWKYGHLKEK